MHLSGRGVVAAALWCLVLSVVLIGLVAVVGRAVPRNGSAVDAGTVVVSVLFIAAFTVAGRFGGRSARTAGARGGDIVLSAVIGCGIAYAVLLLVSQTLVVAGGGQLVPSWDMLYNVLPFLAGGALGGWWASRRRKRSR